MAKQETSLQGHFSVEDPGHGIIGMPPFFFFDPWAIELPGYHLS